MWGRMYPHVILLFVANIILKASCKGTSSLAFVIDDMNQDSRSVKKITNIVLNEKSIIIENMVLVTYNKTGLRVKMFTKNGIPLEENLGPRSSRRMENHDCQVQSMIMKGIYLALRTSVSGSYVYVFIDAPPKGNGVEVKKLCQVKQSQVVFVITSRCSHKYKPEDFHVYNDIAAACSGLTFHVKKSNVDQMYHTIEETLKGSTTAMYTVPAGKEATFPLVLRDHTDYAIVSAFGINVNLAIKGDPAAQDTIMWTKNNRVLKISDAIPYGKFKAIVKGDTNTSVAIFGKTEFFFSYGFSVSTPKTMGQTSRQLYAETIVYMSISVANTRPPVKLLSAQIIKMDGEVIKDLPVVEISKQFYLTEPFEAPSEMFKVSATGIAAATGENVISYAKFPVTPKSLIKRKPRITSMLSTTYQATEGDAFIRIPCVTAGVPKPAITWKLNNRIITPNEKYSIKEGALIIIYPNVSDTNSYTCEATNEVGSDNATYNVYIRQVPKVSGVNITKVNAGAATYIECMVVKGEPKPNITWYFMSDSESKLIALEKYDQVLHIPRVEAKHAGRYKCVVQNNVGSDEHDTTLIVQDIPKISSNKSTLYQATEGDAQLKIFCVAAGVPQPTITWKLNGRTITPNAKYSTEDGSLIIMDPTVNDTSSYTCEATNEVGSDSATYNVHIRQKARITPMLSTSYQATEGDAFIRIPCVTAGVPKPAITWKLNGRVITPSAKYAIEDETLIISEPTVTDTSSYTCEATNEVGTDSATYNVYIRQVPKVLGVNDTKANVGTATNIECMIAKGEPKPNITWYFMGDAGSEFEPLKVFDQVLNISRVEAEHAGRYKCVVQNNVGSDEHVTNLIVQDIPKITSNFSSLYQAIEGDAVLRIPCVAAGLPQPDITWKLNDRIITPNEKYSIKEEALIIIYPNVSDTNSYTCEATNEVGSVSATYNVNIRRLPKISSALSTDYRGTEGDAMLKIPCVTAGVPKPAITWKLNGRVITPSAKYNTTENGTLIISEPTVNDTGSYTCEATNEVGSDSATYNVYIRQVPKVMGVNDTKANVGTATNIECMIAKGEPKPNITWYFMGDAGSEFEPLKVFDQVLNISRVEAEHAGRYKCVVQNNVGSDEHVTTLIVQDIPKISSNFSSLYQAIEGDAVLRIPCVAAGLPQPDITWKLNDRIITPNEKYSIKEGALIIIYPNVSDTNSYTCEATNEVGSVSATYNVNIRRLPKISSALSSDYRGTEGDAMLKIPCATAGVPKPAITWKLNGRVIIPSAKYNTTENGTLIISEPTVNDTGSYTCEATNEVGSDSATYNVYIRQVPKVMGVNDTKANVGTATNIECMIAKGEPKPNITWYFMGDAGSEFESLKVFDQLLNISRVEAEHAGRYKCVVQNNVGSDEHVTTLVVQDIPKITSNFSSLYQAIEGDAVLRIPCVAAGLPQPDITWKLNDRIITPNEKYSIKEGALIIIYPNVSDTNSYTCEATNEVGSVSATYNVNIRRLPKISSALSTDYRGTEGDAMLKIPCATAGVPKPAITWKLNGRVIIPKNGTLIISEPTVNDTGSYTCEATNEVGSDSATYNVYIRQVPKVLGVNDTKANVGTATNIECMIAKGEPKPNITWYFMGDAGSEFEPLKVFDQVLNISRVEAEHAGRYKCVVQNNVGSDEHVTTLIVQDIPKITSNFSSLYQAIEGDAVLRIPCVAAGLPQPDITWKLNDRIITPNEKYSIKEGALIIIYPNVSDTNSYTCEATNEIGSVSATYNVNIRRLPKISSALSTDYRGTEGDAMLKIPCATAGVPKPAITWKLNGRVIIPSAKYNTTENGTLIISEPTVNDTGSYTCEATNEVGTDSATYNVYIRQGPKISGASTKKAKVGTATNIECKVMNGQPKPNITWYFMDKSGFYLLLMSEYDQWLHIPRVEAEHAGRYKCVVQNNVGSDEHVTTLIVQDIPKITSNFSSLYQAIEGDAVLRIPCVAAGLPQPDITWKLNDRIITPNEKYSIKEGALIIIYPNVSDTNSYTCEATNEVGSVNASFTTYIRQAPKLSGQTIGMVRAGTPVLIMCMIVKGEPKPNISWEFKANGSNFTPIAGSNNVLRISNAEVKNAGQYKCVAQNEVGKDEHFITLVVQSPPRILSNSSEIIGLVGDLALRIPCDVIGTPQPTITWTVGSDIISSSSKYMIDDGALVIAKPDLNDNKLYKCEAKNDIATVSATFKANIENNSLDYGKKHYVYLLNGQDKKLECDGFTSKNQSIQWWKEGEKTDNNESYISIVNASISNDGNYTCRVSDKYGHVQTHTYVIDVGFPPNLYTPTPVSNWRGEVKDITSHCYNKAKPPADVEWTYNGRVLTDQNVKELGKTFKWGHYTCNASNPHGSVIKSFDVSSSVCLLSRNLSDAQYMPLLLNESGTWLELDTTSHYSIVEPDVKFTFHCAARKGTTNTFRNFPKQSVLEAVCQYEDMFTVDGKLYKLSDLQCSAGIEPAIVRTKEKCLTETSELIRVGYNVTGFLETYEVCFDHSAKMPLYTRQLMTKVEDRLNAAHNWFTYPGIGDGKAERGFTCKNRLSKCCYGKSQLVLTEDFSSEPAKKSTFIDPLNSVPSWRPCNTNKTTWEDIDHWVRDEKTNYDDILYVWSGTYSLQVRNGTVIPRFLWKVVYFNNEIIIAIIYVNDPNPTKEDIKCENACASETWFKASDEYTYCCSLSDFRDKFGMEGADIGDTRPMEVIEMTG